VRRISFEGVSLIGWSRCPAIWAQAVGAPLNREELKKSLRQLFATGLFETIAVEGERTGDGVALVFRRNAAHLHRRGQRGWRQGRHGHTQLERASQLAPGARYTSAKLSQALEEMRATLVRDGFHEPVITQTLTTHPEEQLVDLAFHVVQGPQARVGAVEVTGTRG